MPYSPDTLRLVLAGYITMTLGTTSESTILALPDFALIIEIFANRASRILQSSSYLYLSLPPTRQDLTQGQMTRRSDYTKG